MRLLNTAIFSLFILALSCRGPQGPTGPPGSGVDGLTDPAIQPRVIDMYPPMNSVGPYNDQDFYGAFELRFNKDMDRSSVRQALRLFSSVSGPYIDTNAVYTHGGDFYTFNVYDSLQYNYSTHWRVGQTYTLVVDTTAKDVNGNRLYPKFSATVTPEPYFRVKRVNPRNGATDMVIQPQIYIDFNSKVDASILPLIQIGPSVAGGRWWIYYYDSTQVVYDYSFASLEFNKTYSITIPSNAHDKAGNTLRSPFVSTFTTTAFRVSNTYPTNGKINVTPSGRIEIVFTGPVDTGSLRPAFSINPPVSGNVSAYYYPSNLLIFNPSPEFEQDVAYNVTISTAIRSMSGVSLDQPYSFTFRTAPFAVTRVYPPDGSTNNSRNISSLSVEFNADIDTGAVRASFLHPGLDGNFYFYPYQYPISFEFLPQTPLAANTTYTMTVQTTMRTKGGQNLRSPYTFSFTTGN